MKRWVDKYYHRLEITAFPVLGIVSTITNICKAGSCECIEKRRLTEQTAFFRKLPFGKTNPLR